MAGQLKVNGVTLATEESGTVTLEAPQIKDSSNNVILDQSGTNPVLKNVEVVNNSSMMFRNKIINGDMRIDQRNGGASVTPTSGQYLVDRFYYQSTQSSKFTAQQNAGGVTPPTGFTKYQGLTSSSSYAVTSSDYFIIRQPIEGFNVADLAWGTASAATVTLSFWVHSSLAGTFGGSLTNTGARWYPFSYTISAANTWEYKTIVIAGDTTGTWATDNTAGIQISWALGVGSSFSGTAGAWTGSTIIAPTGATSVVGTSGATFYITGVQLEKGTVATQFEHRPYGTELALCQRYYYQVGNVVYEILGVGWAGTSTIAYAVTQLPVTMRATPTFSYEGSAIIAIYGNSVTGNWSSIQAMTNYQSPNSFGWQGTTSGLTAATVVAARANDESSNVQFSAEL